MADFIRWVCSSCQRHCKAPAAYAGKTVACKCGLKLRLAKSDAGSEPKLVAAPKAEFGPSLIRITMAKGIGKNAVVAYLDDANAGELAAGKPNEYELKPGKHSVFVRSAKHVALIAPGAVPQGPSDSEALEVTLEPGECLDFQCEVERREVFMAGVVNRLKLRLTSATTSHPIKSSIYNTHHTDINNLTPDYVAEITRPRSREDVVWKAYLWKQVSIISGGFFTVVNFVFMLVALGGGRNKVVIIGTDIAIPAWVLVIAFLLSLAALVTALVTSMGRSLTVTTKRSIFRTLTRTVEIPHTELGTVDVTTANVGMNATTDTLTVNTTREGGVAIVIPDMGHAKHVKNILDVFKSACAPTPLPDATPDNREGR